MALLHEVSVCVQLLTKNIGDESLQHQRLRGYTVMRVQRYEKIHI